MYAFVFAITKKKLQIIFIHNFYYENFSPDASWYKF